MLHGCPLPGLISAKRSEEQDLHDAYFEVFDKYRSVRDFLVDDKWQKGSGVWGREINDGVMVLFIGEVAVSGSSDGYKDPTSRAIATMLLRNLLRSKHIASSGAQYMFSWSWPSNAGKNSSPCTRRISLLRSVGFRRVGRTAVFAFATSPTHPSRYISARDDIDNPPPPDCPVVSKDGVLTYGRPDDLEPIGAEYDSRFFPVHYYLQTALEEQIPLIILGFHRSKPSIIHDRDYRGFTPLLVAVQQPSVAAVRVLLSLGASRDIDRRDNVAFMSARELCGRLLNKRKEKDDAEFGVFRGFDEKFLRIKWLMKKALGEAVGMGGGTEEEYVRKRRWGYRCSVIIDRIPHIPDALLTAPRNRHTQSASESSFKFTPIKDQDVDPSLCFLPSHIRTRLTPPLYKGWRATFWLIHSFLRHTLFQDAPTVSNLREHLKTKLKTVGTKSKTRENCKLTPGMSFTVGVEELEAVDFYLSNGGLLDFSIDYIFQISSMSTYTLNTTHPSLIPLRLHDRTLNLVRLLGLSLSLESPDSGFGRKIRKCALDEELEMARDWCCPGYSKEMLKWGPHEIGVEERAMFRLERFSDESGGGGVGSLYSSGGVQNDRYGNGVEADEVPKQKEGIKKNESGKYAKRFALAIGRE
ncbi:uncharacterized protein STEHIDRAFT_172939 [Stereum hirsutum FP-91666 SS1]|uniref:Uncharacterized protein n=1 Tax=Stereum hirsutum (strain FP-91666) TaxID=721885 RepID=R7S051_STEHR|nr:uncharacterized protein STEHIDRAFT_172939 [Stereum hirsutum FP-91666 SS1]EIM79952.1 hypothetical protein STEHIDRAFT_172939 [Stereum hirsutum FP-91666 SS1]